jgi:hypothetical protein
MWNRSYRWQRRARVGAGMLTLVGILSGLWWLRDAVGVRRAAQGAGELAAELASGQESLVEVTVPSSLGVRAGALVYAERPDGIARVIGRVSSVEASSSDTSLIRLRLLSDAAEAGGTLKGASATLDLRTAMRLLITPDAPDDEAQLARDAIWPTIRAHVAPRMVDALVREVSQGAATLDAGDRALVAASVEALRSSLKPLENELVARLAERAKDAIGVKGIASGVWRTTSDGVRNSGAAVADFWRWTIGRDAHGERIDRSFFSEETSQALAAALEEESRQFWRDHHAEVIGALTKVAADHRDDFASAFNERWATRLYDRVVLPAWLAGQDRVIESVQAYTNDFAARRLLASDGGPRLLFAYALRCALGISDSPLLIFAPDSQAAPGRIVYQSLIEPA